MRRLAAPLLAAAFLAVGIHGAYSYVNNYLLYRGFPPPRDAAGVKPGRLVQVHFDSAPLGRQDSYLIYLPPGYSAMARRGERFPVLYLLHGTASTAEHFTRVGLAGVTLDELLARHAVRPFLIAMPESLDGSFLHDTEWANTPHGAYESAMLAAVRAVDSRWPTLRNRSGRAVAGLSMGGYGAINIWLHHLRLFSVAESWSGYFKQTPTGVFRGASSAVLAANSPAVFAPSRARALRRWPSRVLLYGGTGDPLTGTQAPFARRLSSLGVSVQADVIRGAHSWALWRREMPLALTYAGSRLAGG